MSDEFMTPPKPAPALRIPSSSSSVQVRIIDTTSDIYLPDQELMFTPKIELNNSVHCPSYSFLITSTTSSNKPRHILFDLGTWPDHLTPAIKSRMKEKGFEANAEKHVAQIIDEHSSATGVSRKDIEAVIWSHHHWDHTGDIGTFPSSTALIVGEGFKKANTPGYPENKDSALYHSDFENREFREVEFGDLKIGRCRAHDFFGDGSFYLLDTPGHTVGHICGLARTSTAPDTFLLMAGDASHNMGELRPTQYLPLPKSVKPSPFPRFAEQGCPGELLLSVHPSGKADEPFYSPADGFNADNEEAKRSMAKLMELDADQHVLIVLAHDKALYGDLPFFPKSVNEWFEQNLDERTRWNFVGVFGEAIEKKNETSS